MRRFTLCLSTLMLLSIVSCRSTSRSKAKEAFGDDDALILDALPPGLREFRWSELPKKASLELAEFDVAYFWPMKDGGITAKLFGESLSPLEKFELIFGEQLDVNDVDPDAADRRRSGGITKAYLQSIQDDRGLAWAGHCEGSALAVQWFKPIHPVTYPTQGGQLITIYPHEIRGLLAYWLKGYRAGETGFKISGNRVDPGVSSRVQGGRPVEKTVRDVNPGLFMIALGNFIGSAKESLTADISPTEEVLNFPIVGYEVLEQRILSGAEVNDIRRFNPKAVNFATTKLKVTYVDNHRVIVPTERTPKTFDKTYEFVLELDHDGKIVGGEWMGASQKDHPDFIFQDGKSEVALGETTGNGFMIAEIMRKIVSDSEKGATTPAQKIRMDAFKTHPDNDLGYHAFENYPLLPRR